MPNAANAATVAELLRAAAPDGVEVVDRHRDLAVLAVQGPRSAELLVTVLPGAAELADLRTWRSPTSTGIRVCRTGYTGEHGYELLVPADEAGAVWDALLAAAARSTGGRAGSAARDTLRTEMGYPLHGQDLSPEITPVQAGSGWAVGWTKPEFWGRDGAGGREGGRARRGGCAGCGPPAAASPGRGWTVLDAAGAARGRDDLGDVLPDAEGGHRAGADRHGVRCRRRTTRCRWTSAAAPCRARS